MSRARETPRKVSDDQVEQVVIQTLESTPRGQTHWSTRELAKASGLSRMRASAMSIRRGDPGCHFPNYLA
jgi:hypothetical protein